MTKRFDKDPNDNPRTVLGGNFLCSRQFQETRERTRIVPTSILSRVGAQSDNPR